MSTGRVYLVGAGPGDPDLITVRGRAALAQADVVIHDALVAPELLALAPRDAERIDVGKRAGRPSADQDDINRLLVEKARAGAKVVRLKGGDPFVFGRGGEEALALAGAGVSFEVVPGVTAGVAAPACAGIPVTHRGLAACVTFVTGHEAPGKPRSDLNWRALAHTGGTLVFYMGVGGLQDICSRLVADGLPADTPAAAVRWGATGRQRTVAAGLGDLPDAVRAHRLEPPAIIVVGGVVAMRDALEWFEKRPLFGRRVIVTRPRAQAAGLARGLRKLGADVVEFPTIRIEPPTDAEALGHAAARAREWDWVVFASVNAVDAFHQALLKGGLDVRSLFGCRVAAVGPATARRLAECGLCADVQPDTHTSEALAEAVAAADDLTDRRVLCPRSDAAPPGLARTLAAAGADVTEVTAYRTVPEDTGAERIAAMLEADEVDWVTFTSASAARGFFAAVPPELFRSASARIATIGPRTSDAVRELGFEPAAEAEPHTADGLLAALLGEATQGGEG